MIPEDSLGPANFRACHYVGSEPLTLDCSDNRTDYTKERLRSQEDLDAVSCTLIVGAPLQVWAVEFSFAVRP